MQVRDFKQAARVDPTLKLNIITHSCLGRYALQARCEGLSPCLLTDRANRPLFWRSIDEVRRMARRLGLRSVGLEVMVPQDEVIGRR